LAFTEFLDDIGLGTDDIEAVVCAFDNLQLTWHTSLSKSLRIEHIFIVENIERTDTNPRGR